MLRSTLYAAADITKPTTVQSVLSINIKFNMVQSLEPVPCR